MIMENNKTIGNFPIISEPSSIVMSTVLFNSDEIFNTNHHESSANGILFDEFKPVNQAKEVTFVRSFAETVCLKQIEDKSTVTCNVVKESLNQRCSDSFKRFSVDNLLQNSNYSHDKQSGKLCIFIQ